MRGASSARRFNLGAEAVEVGPVGSGQRVGARAKVHGAAMGKMRQRPIAKYDERPQRTRRLLARRNPWAQEMKRLDAELAAASNCLGADVRHSRIDGGPY